MRQTVRRAVLGAFVTLLLPAIATAQRQQPPQDLPFDPTSLEFRLGSFIVGFVLFSIVAALFIHLGRQFTLSTVQYVRKEPVETGLIGFAAFVGTLIVAVVLTITMIGAIIGLPLVFVLVLAWLVTSVIAYVGLGYEVLTRATDARATEPDTDMLWKSFGTGFVIVNVLNLIPVVNFLVGLVVGSLGLGSAIQHWRNGAYGSSEASADDTSGGDEFDAPGGDEWSDSDPRDPTSTGDEFGAPRTDDQWESATGDEWGGDLDDRGDRRDRRDDNDRGEWGNADSSKRDDNDEFW